ncbi:tRNA (N6-threonylcarbamoyladenosine(37)-N6)-methyltransferase TrmO [Neptuniibacter halophilus]|uniref:tRNA (N6-threonylcarbamoyladenosine(37)-N6)-methyltransferase TrmO n=1 Tax=Neptuniibacter halophilus TaxID=651666 RepID=UPI002573FB60|nr:tRNA (N6-threonylcarbamoyladenosine(37)-N6)-methyltransferase TrmO [Neptuniibacter halophilus]
MSEPFSFTPVATVASPFKEKFGIPRQPGLASSLISRIVLQPGFDSADMVRGLEGCSHIWLLFIFSECVDKGWQPLVRPPRLGGNKKLGVFATRSPFRPNPVGLSPVRLIAIEQVAGKVQLVVSGADLLDGTPIIDIKPYLPYSDRIDEAEFELAGEISTLSQPVIFADAADAFLSQKERESDLPLRLQISELLKCDPRPAYKKNTAEQSYGVRLHDFNIRFRITDEAIIVDSIAAEAEQQ